MTLAGGATGPRTVAYSPALDGQPEETWSIDQWIVAVVLFAVWANLPAIAVTHHGVPPAIAYGFLLLLALPCIYFIVVRREPMLLPRPLLWMTLYLAAAAISGACSDRPREALERLTAHFAEGLVLYVLVVNSVRSKEGFRRVLWALIVAGAFMGTVSIAQRMGRTYDDDLGGLAQVSSGEAIGGSSGQSHVRLAGPVGEKNRYAQILLVLLPIAASLALDPGVARSGRVAAIGAAVAISGGLLFTYSRGALVSAVVLLAWLGWLLRRRIGPVLALGVLVAGGVLIAAPEAANRFVELRTATALAGERPRDADSSVRGRAAENLAAIRIFVEHPWLGVGPGQARHLITEYGNELRIKQLIGVRRAHNMYLEELAEVGILGFVPFAAMLATALVALGRPRRPGARFVLHGALVAYLISAVFLHLSYQRYLFVLLGLVSVAGRWSEESPPFHEQPRTVPASLGTGAA